MTAKHNLAFLHELAKMFEGKCISKQFTKMSDKYYWMCKEGHIWDSVAHNVKGLKRWCPECGKKKSALARRKFTLIDAQELAKSKGGKFLSKTFTVVDRHYSWECKEGHVWSASFHNVKNGGNWCDECAKVIRADKKRKYSIPFFQRFANDKGGKCLSEKFTNVKNYLDWECKEGHKWPATPDNILQGKWCPDCDSSQKGTLDEYLQIAQERGGECLSDKYINGNTKLQFKCSEGHEFKARPTLIKRGSWCTVCNAHLGERICLVYFETIFERKFNKVRPVWLKSNQGTRMELDGYNEELKLAFEHQGIQHYKAVKHFNQKKTKSLDGIIERDKLKVKLCKDQGVTLIQVPSILNILGLDNMKDFLFEELNKINYSIPININDLEIDLNKIYIPELIDELQQLAGSRGGELLSEYYLGATESLEWKCSKGHIWTATPNAIKNSNTWCPKCFGFHQTIDDMQILAQKHNGKCLSKKYINNRTHLDWECELGHVFSAMPANVTSGHWCKKCSLLSASKRRRKYNILDIQRYAELNRSVCLSDEYISSKKLLLFRCKCGNNWERSFEKMKSGKNFCSNCKEGNILIDRK